MSPQKEALAIAAAPLAAGNRVGAVVVLRQISLPHALSSHK